MQPIVQHTLSIYETILNRLPPLVPQNIKQALEVELDRLYRIEDPSLGEIEQSMSEYGMKVWPYIKAFEEIMASHEGLIADKIFIQKASLPLRKKYLLVRGLGGGFQSVYTGSLREHFDHNERRELNELLVDLKRDIRRYAMQAVLTHDRKTYEEKIEYYGRMIEEINTVVGLLREIAKDQGEDHYDLALDVQSNIKAIEHSVAFLGPMIKIEEIRQMPEYYHGRREERRVRWGI